MLFLICLKLRSSFISSLYPKILRDDKAIKLFDSENKFNKTINRQSFEQTSVLKKQDQINLILV